MKTLIKLFSATLFVTLMTGCGPSPDALCDHMIELAKKEGGEEAAKMIDKAECVKSAEKKKEMQGLVKFNEKAGCIMDAEDLAGLAKCDE